uniref:DUF7895 domain-containing protein n=1 Tax=Leersia perrieri TaxID=77586 RepID=A0A0D9WUG2_9ORYZ
MAAAPVAGTSTSSSSSSSASIRSRCFLLQASKPSWGKQQLAQAAAVVGGRRRAAAAAAAGLPVAETAAACVAAVGVAATALSLLVGRAPAAAGEEQQQNEVNQQECSDCGGTGLCPRCKGEGFVFKQLPEDAATRARKAAKNMATRYTAGLPTKWTYCNRCSSTRSCTTCAGSGSISATKPPPTN